MSWVYVPRVCVRVRVCVCVCVSVCVCLLQWNLIRHNLINVNSEIEGVKNIVIFFILSAKISFNKNQLIGFWDFSPLLL